MKTGDGLLHSCVVVVVVVSLIITLSTAKQHQFCRLKLCEIKHNISLNDVHTWQQ